jgi:hypothetical protein
MPASDVSTGSVKPVNVGREGGPELGLPDSQNPALESGSKLPQS